MHELNLRLLGTPAVTLDNAPTEVRPRKALAILVYLASQGGRHTRDSLATLLWPNSGQSQARASLRRRLSELSNTLAGEWLDADGDSVILADAPGLHVDVAAFESHLARCARHGHDSSEVCAQCRQPLECAVTLYTDDFLTGFTLPDCPEFDDWQFFRAEELRLALSDALQRLITLYNTSREFASALPHARRWLSLDPLHEPAHRELMRLYALTDQYSAALRQYQLCADVLETELSVPVSDETAKLYDAIVSRKLKPGVKSTAVIPAPPAGEETADDRPAAQDTAQPASTQDDVRVITILDADLNLSVEEDWDSGAADTVERLAQLVQQARELLTASDATINRSVGGGFQALFGLSHVHEDDPERAIRAAIDIQSAAKEAELDLTIGVATGVVYVRRSDSDVVVTGRAATLASRLQSAASPGQIVVSESTYRQTHGAVRYIAYDEGRGTPGCYRVEGLRRVARKARGVEGLRAQLVGRDEELSKLVAALAKAMQGRGQIASIIGEAGVGKSRLVGELRVAHYPEAPNTGDVDWLEGRCLEMTSGTAYAPFVGLLHGYFGWSPGDPENERAQAIVESLAELSAHGLLSEDQREVMGAVFGNLLSVRFGNEWDDWAASASPEHIRFQTFQALVEFILALGRQKPRVLALEDLHWADALSLDMIAVLLEKLEDAPLMLLCTYRPEHDHRSWQLATIADSTCPDAFTELRLRNLTRAQMEVLLEQLVGRDAISPSVLERIYEQCHGNPYYLEEILHALIDSGDLVNDGQKWELTDAVAELSAPPTVHSVTLSRYDRLSPQDRDLLQHAAILGRRFDKAMLSAMVGEFVDVDEPLEHLQAKAFVYQERTMPQEIYAFRHVLAQQAVYQTLPPARRASLHGQAGAILEHRHRQSPDEVVELVAYHYARSDEDEKAVEFLLRAAEKSRRAYLTDEAVAEYLRALQRIDRLETAGSAQSLPISERRLAAQVGLGQIYSWTAQYSAAEDSFREAIELAKSLGRPARELARLHFWLGENLNWQDKQEESIRLSLDALAILGDDTECAEAAMINAALAWSYIAIPDPAGFVEYGLRNNDFIENVPFSEEMRSVYTCLVEVHYYTKNESRAVQLSNTYQENSRRTHDLWSMAEMHLSRARHLIIMKGDHKNSLRHIRESSDLFQQVGDPVRQSYMSGLLGLLALNAGELDEAERHISAVLETVQRFGHVLSKRLFALDLASLHLARHDWNEGYDWLDTDLFRGFIPVETETWHGRIRLAQGQREAAQARLMQALDSMVVDDLGLRYRLWSKVGWRPLLVDALCALEEAMEDDQEFARFCRQYQEEHPEFAGAHFQQWHLTTAVPDCQFNNPNQLLTPGTLERIESDGRLRWEDPYADCSYVVDGEGVTIFPAMLRDLWFLNQGAPRLTRPVDGDVAVQVRCERTSPDQIAIGGVLLWQDKENYLRLGIGIRAQHEVSLEGCIDNQDIVFGRGLLHVDRPYLRLERNGNHIRALCSADGDTWFAVGECDFPSTPELRAGIYAIGHIDRTVYYGAFAEGTATRFTEFAILARS